MTSNEYPLISILLPLYNAELYIRESIESILKQTYPNWELLIADDGSTDNSAAIVESFKDERIHLIRKKNTGMGDSLNQLLSKAKGDFIARQDADDNSLPNRFEKQIEFFRNNTNVGLIGTWTRIINEKGKETGRYHKHPTDSKELEMDLFFDNPFVHSSVMFRKNILENCGSYDTSVNSLVQDFEYWFRISRKYKTANIPEVLHEYREIQTSISRTVTDFGEVVANQCAKNISSVLKDENSDLIANFAFFYHGSKKIKVEVDKKILFEFERIVKSVDKVVSGNFDGKYSLKHIQMLKRKFYSLKIYSEKSSLLTRFCYKVKRRIMNLG